MASDAQTLAKWQAYINDYEQKLENHSFDLSTSSGRSSYTRMETHLNSLRSKYAYLQQYYAQYGELPANVTFERIEGAGGAYRTEVGGEIKTITFEGGGNGGMTVSAPDFTGTYHWQGPPELIASSYADREGSPQSYGIEVEGPAGAGYISMDVTGVLFSGMSSTYHFHYETIPSRWSVSLNINDTIPVYDQTSPLGMNAFTFNGGVSWVLEEMTVPTDEPWRYYETKIKPNIPPGDDIYPNGYDPGSEDEPPEEGKPDKDEKDSGTPPEWERVSELRATMTKFYVMTPTTYNQLRLLLSQTVQDSWNNPTDESKFMYLLGKLRKGAGTQPEYETAANNFIGEYLVGCKAYPFDLKTSKTYNNGNYTANPAATIAFGYNGAGLDVSSFTDTIYDLTDSIIESKTVAIDCPNRAGTNSTKDCTFLDFEPFTNYSILLPYVGEFDLPARQVVCAHLTIVYTLDFTSGTVLAEVYTKGGYNTESEGYADTILLLKKTGVIGCSCSIAGNDLVKQGDQMVIASTAAKGTVVHTLVNDINANIPTEAKTLGSLTQGDSPLEGLANYAVSNITAKYDKILNMPNRVEEIFSNNQNMAMAGVNKTQASRDVPFILAQGTNISPFGDIGHPTLRIKKTRAFYPEGFGHMYGYPKQNTMKLGSLKGFFQTTSIDVSGIGGIDEPIPTEIEQKMINDALKSGSFMNNS